MPGICGLGERRQQRWDGEVTGVIVGEHLGLYAEAIATGGGGKDHKAMICRFKTIIAPKQHSYLYNCCFSRLQTLRFYHKIAEQKSPSPL